MTTQLDRICLCRSEKEIAAAQSVKTGAEDPSLRLDRCCMPIIRGKAKAPTAESLMRARYTAFALAEVDFIIDSHHPDTRGEVKRDEIEEWSKNSEWLGLEIAQTEMGTEKDNDGIVIFHARYKAPDPSTGRPEPKVHDHWERSLFRKHDGAWKFLDAQGIQQGPIKRDEPKVGRNDVCPCGSGKKYKKCHAA